MWKILGLLAMTAAFVQSADAQVKQVSPYYGPCRNAVMKQPGMTSATYGHCNAACGAAINRCVARKGKI